MVKQDYDKIEAQLAYVLERSEFYRKRLSLVSLEASELINRFGEIPFTNKVDVVADQLKHPPYGSNLCVIVTN